MPQNVMEMWLYNAATENGNNYVIEFREWRGIFLIFYLKHLDLFCLFRIVEF